ncbi:MAG: hypothetical protein COB51_03660 [Moraxellaceae bacterium]|nr:MAG: hypothetical protein COB51_03660 [Moraxellaceae bacterium]
MRSQSLKLIFILLPLLLSACGGEEGNSVLDEFQSNPAAICGLTMDEAQQAPLVVTLDGRQSSSPEGEVIAYQWQLGDGAISRLSNFTHTYEQPASYTITLTVFDDQGKTDACTRTLIVSGNASTETILEGFITIPSNTRVDSDANDPLTSASLPNNNFTLAQELPNPVILGGFAAAIGTAISGDVFEISADVSDFYHLSLTQGQQVTLTSFDQDAEPVFKPNFDLYLYRDDDATTEVARSTLSSEQDSLSVADTNDYYIEVRAAAGFGNYILNIGSETATAGGFSQASDSGIVPSTIQQKPSSSAATDFVAGDIIIKTLESSELSSASSSLSISTQESFENNAASLGLIKKAGQKNKLLYSLGNKTNQQKVLSKLGLVPEELNSSIPQQSSLDATSLLKQQTLQAIAALNERQDIEWAEPNYILRASFTPNDEFYNPQWHYPLINLPQAWEFTQGDASITVAVVDSGIVLTHPDLTDNLLNDGYDFISDSDSANDNDGIDPDPNDPGDGNSIDSSSFHGTHVAGTIAALSNNFFGVAGVSWNTKILPLRVLGQDGASSYDLSQALLYAAGLENDSGTTPAKKADIINLSLGSEDFSNLLSETIATLVDEDIIIVAAAGNEAHSAPHYPSSYPGVFSVGAIDSLKNLTSYSNTGADIDLVAPGGDLDQDQDFDGYPDGILSTSARDSNGEITADYAFYQGTSMSASHVSGVFALMKAVHPGLNNDELNNLLALGKITQDLKQDGAEIRNDEFGYGLIDALKAVNEANLLVDGAPLPSVTLASPASLNFGFSSNALNLSITQFGSDNVANLSFSNPAETWLNISTQPAPADNELLFLVQVDRESLADGIYNASILIQSIDLANDANDLIIPVTMAVGEPDALSDAGRQYVLVLDEDRNTVQSIAVDPINGTYSFQTSTLAAGVYYIISGTDLDNDGYICDAGEACGGYPLISDLEKVTVNSNTIPLNFSSGFSLGLSFNSAQFEEDQPGGYSRTITIVPTN